MKVVLGQNNLILNSNNTIIARNTWTPADGLDDLVGWYDATDASTVHFHSTSAPDISAWDDKSGNGYHLNDSSSRTGGTSRPSYGDGQINGLSSVNFYQTFDRIMRTGIPDINTTDGATVIAVAEFTGGIYNNIAELASTDETDKVYARRRASNNRLAGVIVVDGVAVQPQFPANDPDYALNTPFLCSSYYDGDRGYITGNGGADSASGDLSDGATITINFIGTGRCSSDTCNHKTGEVIILKTSNVDIRQKVEGYLAWKWDLTDKLPSSHPYKNNPPI